MPNAGPRRRSNLTFDGTVINIGIQNEQFRLKLQTENDLLFGRVAYGRWYRLVGRVDFDVEGLSDRLSMWVDPTSKDQLPGGVLEGRDIGTDLGNDLQIHRDDRVEFEFADVRIGTEFASVVPEAVTKKSP